MTDIPEDEWRYSINYGPEGEANYAFVYDGGGNLVSNLRIHHAIAVVEQMNARAAQAERMARLEEALEAEEEADRLFDAADEYTHRADGEGWLNDPTGSLHVTEAWDRAHQARERAKELRRAARALSQEGSEPS